MSINQEVAALRAQLRLTGLMMGQMFGLIARSFPLTEEEIETFCAAFSTGNGINDEFMDQFQSGLDQMLAGYRRSQDLPLQAPAPSS